MWGWGSFHHRLVRARNYWGQASSDRRSPNEHAQVRCLNVVAAVGGRTLAIAARERSVEAAAAVLMSASLLPLQRLESLPARQYWERRRRPLAAEGEAVIVPAPEVVGERMKEAEGVVLAVVTVRQTTVAAALARLAEQEPMIYSRMVYESWAAEAASSLLEEAAPLMKQTRLAARWQLSSSDSLSMRGWPGLVSLDAQGLQVPHRQAVEEQRLLAVSARMTSKTQGRIGMMRLDRLEYVRCLKIGVIIDLNVPPVSTPPPVFLSFGMPPAKRPASCGAASMGAAGASRLP